MSVKLGVNFCRDLIPPSPGSSPVQSVYGGAQRASFLASGLFTGESTWKPPHLRQPEYLRNYNVLRSTDYLESGFYRFCQESTLPKPASRNPPNPAHHLQPHSPEQPPNQTSAWCSAAKACLASLPRAVPSISGQDRTLSHHARDAD